MYICVVVYAIAFLRHAMALPLLLLLLLMLHDDITA